MFSHGPVTQGKKNVIFELMLNFKVDVKKLELAVKCIRRHPSSLRKCSVMKKLSLVGETIKVPQQEQEQQGTRETLH